MLLKTALSNQLRKEAITQGVEIDIYLKNILINGQKRGCSGHVVNRDTGSCAYLNTEDPWQDKVLYRLALDNKDWGSNGIIGGYNRWCYETELAENVITMIKKRKGFDQK